jgi:uncharacterized membrane protein
LKEATLSSSTLNNSNNSSVPELTTSRKLIQSVKAKADAKRSTSERVADWLTEKFGTMAFLVLNFAWFGVWIIINSGLIPGIEPFDPFPFTFLTMVVSLEAIGLAIIVLMSQNRASKIADLREEVDLQVDTTTEAELTKLLVLMKRLLEKEGIDVSSDPELDAMLEPTDVDKLETVLENQVVKGEKDALESQSAGSREKRL